MLNLKLAPLTTDGRWRRSAVDLAEVLGCTCEDLFSETQRTLALRDGRGESFITESRFLELSGRVALPLLENPGEQLLEDADEQAKGAVVRQALDGLHLSPRGRKIIESHFGIGCDERSLGELALEHGVSYHFVRARVLRALSKLSTRRSLLQAYRPAGAMGKAAEAHLRMAKNPAGEATDSLRLPIALKHTASRHPRSSRARSSC